MSSPRQSENDAQAEKYADFIGLNLKQYPELKWIALEGLSCPVPEGWEIVKDGSTGHYFRNTNTGATRNDHPMDDHYRVQAQKHMALIQDRLRNRSPPSSRPSSSRDLTTMKKKSGLISALTSKSSRYMVYLFLLATFFHFFVTMGLTPVLAEHLMPNSTDDGASKGIADGTPRQKGTWYH